MTRSVLDVWDGLVRSADPPDRAVHVTDTWSGSLVTSAVYIGETEELGRHDIIVRTPTGLKVILGRPTPDVGTGPVPSWHLVRDDDVVLAVVKMPPRCSSIFQSFIEDRRAFDAPNGRRS